MIQLYSYYRSSSSYRIRIALNLKGLSYETKPVHLVRGGGEQFSGAITQLNPAQRIPILVHDQIVISQSMAILEYLEEAFPQTALLPKDLQARARVRQLAETINSDTQPLQNLGVLKKLEQDLKASEEQRQEWCRHWIGRGLKTYEEILTGSKDEYSVGNQPSLADCLLVPQIYNAERFGVDLKPFPKIVSIHKRCLELKPFQEAHPDRQPDTPR